MVSARLSIASLIVMVFACIIAGISLLIAATVFNGFLGDGRSWIGATQAFLLCFGGAAGIAVPAMAVFFMARNVRGKGRRPGPSRRIGAVSALLSLPLWLIGGCGLMARWPYTPYLVLSLILGLGLLWWAVSVLRANAERDDA